MRPAEVVRAAVLLASVLLGAFVAYNAVGNLHNDHGTVYVPTATLVVTQGLLGGIAFSAYAVAAICEGWALVTDRDGLPGSPFLVIGVVLSVVWLAATLATTSG